MAFTKFLELFTNFPRTNRKKSTQALKSRGKDVLKEVRVLEKTSEAKPLNILESLPPELIIYIAEFLPLSSLILFALSCHAAYVTLGTRQWNHLRAEGQHEQHVDFLSQLAKDLPPNYIPCYHCRVLHQCEIRYSDHLPTRPLHQYDVTACYKAEVVGGVSKYIHKDFQFRTFQMAMKQYRLGLDYKIWLDSLCRESKVCRIMGKFPSEFKAEARIVDSGLLFRSQRVILIPPGLTIRNLDRCSFHICRHIRLTAHGANANFPDISECTINHQHAFERCVRRSEVVHCTVCPTEYDFSLVECNSLGVAAIITKWMDLGDGRTPLDPRWLSHLSQRYIATGVLREGEGITRRDPVRSDHASIRDAFTRQNDPSELDTILPLETAQKLLQLPKLPILRGKSLGRAMLFDLY